MASKFHNGIHYKLIGNGPIKLCFVSGLMATMHTWYYQVKYFLESKNFTVLLLDNRGSGQSCILNTVGSIDDMTKDIISLLDHLKIERMHFVGISMGGMILLNLLKDNGNYVESTTIINSGFNIKKIMRTTDMIKNGCITYLNLAKNSLYSYVYGYKTSENENTLKTYYNDMAFNNTKKYSDKYLKLSENQTYSDYIFQYSALLKYRISDESLRKIKEKNIPTIIICGFNDKVIKPESSMDLKEKINAKLFLFKKSSHLMNIQSHDKLNILLKQFIYSTFLHNNIINNKITLKT